MTKNNSVSAPRWSLVAYAAVLALILVVPVSASAQCTGRTADRDGDGLSNCVERYVTHTDARNADTDHDGLSDGLEVSAGLDPTSADADQDGLDDGNEALAGTNPHVADSDQDGVDDANDPDPAGRLTQNLGGTIEAVDATAQKIVLLGTSVDLTGATFRHVTDINGLAVGMHVEVHLDVAAAALGVYHATNVSVDDSNGDGVIDDGSSDSSSGSDNGGGDTNGSDPCPDATPN
jgi:hypothetical protein